MLLEADNVDVCVVGLIGERGREVSEFVERMFAGPAAQRTILVAATSDRSASERFNAGLVATSIAEAFRDRGAHALLILDSVTRLARALREIGLANGEPPTRRGFPPTVFSELPRLFERAGTNERGAITAIYNVLVEGDTSDDPIAEDVRSIIDGHIVLSRRLAEQGHFPAIDVPASLSRLMTDLIDNTHRISADKVRAMLSLYEEVELLLQVGEYEKGADPSTDEAVEKNQRIKSFLAQDMGQRIPLETALKQLKELC
jgi:type III secretion protein N (ATPase)